MRKSPWPGMTKKTPDLDQELLDLYRLNRELPGNKELSSPDIQGLPNDIQNSILESMNLPYSAGSFHPFFYREGDREKIDRTNRARRDYYTKRLGPVDAALQLTHDTIKKWDIK